jgi:hypothetical protein
MSDTNGRLRGSKFYKAKGLRTLIVRTPNETKTRLRLLSVTLGKAVHETVQLILDDFAANRASYKDLGDGEAKGDKTEITVFVTPESRQDLKIEGVKSGCAMKDLAGRVVHRYLTERTKIQLGDS